MHILKLWETSRFHVNQLQFWISCMFALVHNKVILIGMYPPLPCIKGLEILALNSLFWDQGMLSRIITFHCSISLLLTWEILFLFNCQQNFWANTEFFILLRKWILNWSRLFLLILATRNVSADFCGPALIITWNIILMNPCSFFFKCVGI